MSDTPAPGTVTSSPSAKGAPPAATLGEPLGRHNPSMTLQAGAHVAGYRIERVLGTGGMGRVYLAHDATLDRKVALKVLPPEEADDEARARFLREAQALARVHHDHVVKVFASGADGDVAWMALEYVEGDPLSALLGAPEDGGGCDEETALSLCAQAARGLAAVHAVGVVHRDVKPDNLLMDKDGVLRVVDFGVALFVDGRRGGFVTQAGVAIGTPHFMAPEQARGGAIDARADAWGLGATLYALLTGRPPFFERDDDTDLDILARVLRDRAPDVRVRCPQVSGATAALIARLLAPEVDKRPDDLELVADEMLGVVDALARGELPSAPDAAAAVASGDEPAVEGAPSASPAAAEEGTPRWLATAGVLTVAVLFLVLGANLGAILRPPTPVADAGVVATPPPPPTPLPAPPPPAPAPPPAVKDVEPPPPAPPTPEERAASIKKHPEANMSALKALVDEEGNEARTALAIVLADPGDAGELALSVIAARGARRHVPLVGGVLRTTTGARAMSAVGVLQELRSEDALALLNDAAAHHRDKRVRERAKEASEALFSVE